MVTSSLTDVIIKNKKLKKKDFKEDLTLCANTIR